MALKNPVLKPHPQRHRMPPWVASLLRLFRMVAPAWTPMATVENPVLCLILRPRVILRGTMLPSPALQQPLLLRMLAPVTPVKPLEYPVLYLQPRVIQGRESPFLLALLLRRSWSTCRSP